MAGMYILANVFSYPLSNIENFIICYYAKKKKILKIGFEDLSLFSKIYRILRIDNDSFSYKCIEYEGCDNLTVYLDKKISSIHFSPLT